MKIPHKWPGKKKLVVMFAAMRILDTIHPERWKAGILSSNYLKKQYPALRYLMRVVVELHEKSTSTQRGKENG